MDEGVFPIKECLLVKLRKSWFDSKEIKRRKERSNAGLLVESQKLKWNVGPHYILNLTCCIFPGVGRCRLRTMWYTLLVTYLFFASGIHFLVNVRNDALSAISHDGFWHTIYLLVFFFCQYLWRLINLMSDPDPLLRNSYAIISILHLLH